MASARLSSDHPIQGLAGPPKRHGRNHAYGPETVEALRGLVEGTKLPMRAIAARVGVGRSTVASLTARHGWRRPRPARVPLAGQRGGGHAIVPEVVEAARALIEGTALSYAAISAKTGVSRTALCRWRKRRGWRRPPEAPTGLAAPRPDHPGSPYRSRRLRGRPYSSDAVGGVQRLLTQSLLPQAAIARQLGISQWAVSDWMRRRGWARPTVPPSSQRFAASRRTGPLATSGDRRGRPYALEIRREARALWELTRWPTELIGRELGVHAATVARWARAGEWERPRGRLGRRQLRGFFGVLKRG